MSFPETIVLSTFTGTDGSKPVTGFSNLYGPISMYFTNTGTVETGAEGGNYWDAGTYTQPIDVNCSWAHKGVAAVYVAAVLAQSPGASYNGYVVSTASSGTKIQVYRATSGNSFAVQIGADFNQALAQGDQFGFRLHTSGNIEVYVNIGGGGWTSLGTRGPDTTYTGAFYAGYICGTNWDSGTDGQSIDGFSAGNAVEDEVTISRPMFRGS